MQGDGFNKAANNVELIAESLSADSVGVGDTCAVSLNKSAPPQNGPLTPQVSLGLRGVEKENLIEVQVEAGSETLSLSSHSVSIEPKFDAVSILYSIKPKLIRHIKSNSPFGIHSNSLQLGVAGSSQLKKSSPSLGKKKVNHFPSSDRNICTGLGAPLARVGRAKRVPSLSNFEPKWVEARASMEVCDAVGLIFNEDREVILESFAGVGRRFISLWDPDFFICEDSLISQNFIGMKGRFAKNSFSCVVINVYGPNLDTERLKCFEELKSFIQNFNAPIILGGDFNVV
ncbi:hypothetical protein V6N13_065805 [Hibiscus sabdariffa]